MRNTVPSKSERPQAASPTPPALRTAGNRSGEGSASVLEYLVQDRLRYSDRNAPQREQRG
jgi:hypothetical protein